MINPQLPYATILHELIIVEATEQGRADIRDGWFTPHEDVTREARVIIATACALR
jgi:hypothetical protein